MEDEKLEIFAKIFIGFHNDVIIPMRDRAFKGQYRKNSTAEEEEVNSFIWKLSEEEKEILIKLVSQCVEATLFQVLYSFEHGVGGHNFELNMINWDTHEEVPLIRPNKIPVLSMMFFDWIKQHAVR